MGCGVDTFATYTQAQPDFIWPIPDDMTLEDGATLPVVYLTVYYSFYRSKLLKKGDSVLIHAGMGGVGQAAIRVAHSLGVEIFTTCSASKRAALKGTFPFLLDDHVGDPRSLQFEEMVMRQTAGKGVTAVLNSLAGEKLRASFRCVKQHGYFLELGKYDFSTNANLSMKEFLSNLTFCAIDIDQVFEQPEEMAEISRRFAEGLASGVARPLNYTTYPFVERAEALKFLASGTHTGKVLIDMQGVGETVPFEAKYYTHGTHLITGGLGGFAMALAKWLAERGAKKLVLATRRGICDGEHVIFLQSLRDSHVDLEVQVTTDDLTSEETVKKLASGLCPITGVWHLAMVLNDALLKDMTPEQWSGTVRAKTDMGKLLSEHLGGEECETFVCFSSVSSKFGNGGQCNYAYANNELEQLCAQRAEDGLSACCVQWGAIDGVGFVARQKNSRVLTASFVDRVGVDAQSLKSCLVYLEAAILCNVPVVASHRRAERTWVAEASANAGSADLLQIIGKLLGVDLKRMSEDVLLVEVGLDSLTAATAHAATCRAIGETFPLSEMSQMTIGKLAALQSKATRSAGVAGP